MPDFTSILRRIFGLQPICQHEWGDDHDFVSCSVITIHSDPNVQPTSRAETISTLQWCLLCGEERRKPGSARPAVRAQLEKNA